MHTRHQLRTRRDVLNVPRGVRQALGDWCSLKILEASSFAKSDTRSLSVRQQFAGQREGCTMKHSRSVHGQQGSGSSCGFERGSKCV